MMRILLLALLSVCACAGAARAAQPFYTNNTTVIDPQIDAVSVINNGTILTATTLPFDTANTSFLTNNASGVFSGSVGFRFELVTNGNRLPAVNVVNRGTISGTSHLIVNATNITNSGTMTVGVQGLVHLEGKRIDLTRGGVSAGGTANNFVSDGFDFGNFYQNPSGVSDLYWGAGTNGIIGTAGGSTIFLPSFLSFPFIQSPFHRVVFPGNVSNNVTVPGFFSFGREFQAFAYTNQVFIGTNSNSIVQVVFVPTDTTPGLTTRVRFDTNAAPLAAQAIVEFSVEDVDITTQQPLTNRLYLIDSTAVIGTNAFRLLSNNFNFNTLIDTFKPGAYQIRRQTPFNWPAFDNANTTYSNELLVNYTSNAVNYNYAGYSAQIGPATDFASPNPTLAPSNSAGRIEVVADTVDLSNARLRSETFINVNTTNLVSTTNAGFDAPFINFKFTTTNASLTVDTLATNSVKRLGGTVSAWSGLWTNIDLTPSTNRLVFHVLIVDHTLQASQPVSFGEFSGKGNSLILEDPISPVQSFTLNAPAVTVGTNGVLNFITDASLTQLPVLRHLTNHGAITAPGSILLGMDAPQAYSNFINRGSIIGSTIQVRAQTLNSSGSLATFGGPLVLQFGSGTITSAVLNAAGDLRLVGGSLAVSNSSFDAATALMLTLTNSLSDGFAGTFAAAGTSSTNLWTVRDGLQFLSKPATGDLLGTTVRSIAPQFRAVPHRSALEDRGATTNGYGNNAALGRLILDGSNSTLFAFSPVGATNALYVDFLELVGNATNYLTALQIDPGMTLYFADCNLPAEKLDGAFSGRLRWVSGYTGANSSLLVTNSDGGTMVVNRAVRDSSTLDSDADGIPNRYDAFPFDPVAVTLLTVPSPGAAGGAAFTALISWEAAANTTYRVDCKQTLGGAWQFLMNYTHGGKNGTATVSDPIVTNGACFYRVTYYR